MCRPVAERQDRPDPPFEPEKFYDQIGGWGQSVARRDRILKLAVDENGSKNNFYLGRTVYYDGYFSAAWSTAIFLSLQFFMKTLT